MVSQQQQEQTQGPSSHWPRHENPSTLAVRSKALQQASRQRSDAEFNTEQEALARAIETEIIPRLMLTHSVDQLTAPSGTAKLVEPPSNAVELLANLALDQPLNVGVAYLEKLLWDGVSAESVYLDVIGPAARYIGDLWSADVRDFTDVTVALTRLQSMLNDLSPVFESEQEARFSMRSALLIPGPGEQHSLGLSMVSEFFRRAGWHVHPETPATIAEIQKTVQSQRFDVVGFSVSCDRFLDDLTTVIRTVRKVSKNRSVGVLVGGDVFNRNPHLVSVVGADATAADGRDAIRRVPALLGLSVATAG